MNSTGRQVPGTPPGEEEDEETRSSRRRLTRIMLVLVVLVLAVLGAEIAYFIGFDRTPATTATRGVDWSGWQRVADSNTYASYRVPQQFTLEEPLQRRSLGLQTQDGPDLVVLRSTAVVADRACAEPGAITALAGFVEHTPDGEIAGVQDLVEAAAQQSLTRQDGTVPQLPTVSVQSVSLADGTPAEQASLTVPVTEPYPCSPPRLRFTALDFSPRDRRAQFLLITDVGDDRELPPGMEQQILDSVDATP